MTTTQPTNESETMSNIDKNIAKLAKGRTHIISDNNGIKFVAERSGDGETLRFVRITANGFEVVKTCKF